MDGFGLGFVSGSQVGQVIALYPPTRVGRAPGMELRLEDPGVAHQHAQIYSDGASLLLRDLHSPGGSYVDGERVPAGHPWPLYPGALLRFGEGGPLALFESLGALQGGLHGGGALVLVREDGPGGEWPVRGALQVGRGATCEVQLDPLRDTLASSQHLHLLPAFGRLIATDLGSANGTWVNGRRVLQRVIAPGTRIHLGGAGGPCLRVDAAPLAPAPEGPSPMPETFSIEVSARGERARIDVALKTEVTFGSFAGLNDFETVCFPRELESERDAEERSEAVAPQQGTLVLTSTGVELQDSGQAQTKVDGHIVRARARVPLRERFELDLGGDALGLRGRLFKHPRLPPTAPRIGIGGQHPVECLALERKGDGPESRLYLLLVRQATIGSSDDAAICLPLPGIGQLHALLYVQDDALWISQLGPDPVSVDGVPLSPGTTVPLRIGAEVYLGTAKLKCVSC